MSKTIRGALAFLALCGLSLLLLNCGSTVNRSSGLLYVLIQGTNQISSYAINLTSGNLSLINSNASTCASGSSCGLPLDIILDAAGKTAFVLNQGPFNPGPPPSGGLGTPSIYGYTINSDGSLAAGSDVSSSLNLQGSDLGITMVRDAGDKFIFLITAGNQTVNPGSSLCQVAGQNVQCPQLYVLGTQSGSTTLSLVNQYSLKFVPTALAVETINSNPELFITGSQDLSGTTHLDSTLHEYAVDGSGNVTEEVNSPYVTTGSPGAVLALTTAPIGSTAGTFVYVASATANNLAIFQVCTVQSTVCSASDAASRALVPVSSSSTAGSNPVAMVKDPTNSFLYVAAKNSNQVFGFRINATEGTLTALSPANLSTGLTPVALAMHSSGKFLFVSNNGSANLSSYVLDITSGAMSSPLTITSLGNPAGLVSK
jgi:6-phosphogluconolactonase (cycloisomerase 2 family)